MKTKHKIRHYKTRFRFDKSCLEYEIGLRKKRNKWGWLLLLLFPLLLIRCEKDVWVEVTDERGEVLPQTEVSLDYVAHYLYKNGLLKNEAYRGTEITDSTGIARFEHLGYSVFSSVFYMFLPVQIAAKSECYELEGGKSKWFHFIFSGHKVCISLKAIRQDVQMKVVDDELGTPVADAVLYYTFDYKGEIRADSLRTDENGIVAIPDVPCCQVIDRIDTRKYGYREDVREGVDVAGLLSDDVYRTVRLVPVKEKIDFFVKNKFTRQPVPGATVVVTLEDRRMGKRMETTVVTNVDGAGRGFYEDAFVLAELQLKATRFHFKAGQLEKKYRVKDFLTLPDSLRTVWLEPEPYVVEFRNVDTLTCRPVTGVNNRIVVKGIDGNEQKYAETSNRNGYFCVKAREGDWIEIVSVLLPGYQVKQTVIPQYDKEETVWMYPKVVSLDFRTLDGYDNSLLPDCSLEVYADGQPVGKPVNSGNGNFRVEALRLDQRLTIVASKKGFQTNGYKIKDILVAYLAKAPQTAGDIPLELPDCQTSGTNNTTAGSGCVVHEYDLKQASGMFRFDYYTDVAKDHITVYNCRATEISEEYILFDKDIATGQQTLSEMLPFTSRIISVKVEGTTRWSYVVNCPE